MILLCHPPKNSTDHTKTVNIPNPSSKNTTNPKQNSGNLQGLQFVGSPRGWSKPGMPTKFGIWRPWPMPTGKNDTCQEPQLAGNKKNGGWRGLWLLLLFLPAPRPRAFFQPFSPPQCKSSVYVRFTHCEHTFGAGWVAGCSGTYLTHAQTCENVRVQSATQWTFYCSGTYFAHAQTCENVRVQSATQWTAYCFGIYFIHAQTSHGSLAVTPCSHFV